MDLALLETLIGSYGFPIVMVAIMCWYIYDTNSKNREDRKESEEKHKEEMDAITEALNNNTIALTKLTVMLDSGESNEDK